MSGDSYRCLHCGKDTYKQCLCDECTKIFNENTVKFYKPTPAREEKKETVNAKGIEELHEHLKEVCQPQIDEAKLELLLFRWKTPFTPDDWEKDLARYLVDNQKEWLI